MNNKSPFKSISALLAIWLIPLLDWSLGILDSRAMTVGVVLSALIVTFVICGACRDRSWIVFIWVPLMTSTSLGSVIAAVGFLSAKAESSSSGPGAPLEGVATLIVLVVILGALILSIASYLVRPRQWPPASHVILAITNVLAFWLFMAS